LDSWKEIGAYLGRSEKTVRRWEDREGLPVHRLLHEKGGSVYGYTGELDAWRNVRKAATKHEVVASDGDARIDGRGSSMADLQRTDEDRLPKFHHRPWFISFFLITAISVIGLLVGIRRGPFLRGSSPVPIQSLAVLPLENLSGEAGWEYFADGMTAELITELAKISSLRVISRTSAMHYKRTRKPLKEIARELNVDAVVEGEVLNSNDRVRVTAQLIQTATDRHLWAETYERDLRDAVELQSEVAESITNAIKARVTRAEHARLTSGHRANAEAYQAYLKGRYYWNKRGESGLKKSVEYFRLAINIDPQYALAYAALADSYQLSGVHEWAPIKGAYSQAKWAAKKALELDNSLGEAHTVLAGVRYGLDRDWRGAEREFKLALELSPGYATAHTRYAVFLMRMGRTAEGLAEVHRAQSLDPLSPGGFSRLGWQLLSARRYDEAVEQFQNSLEMDPDAGVTHMDLGRAYEGQGDFEKAINELRKAAALSAGPIELASLAHAYARGGYMVEARSILKDLEERSVRAYVPPYDMAIVYAGLGKKDRAFEWLAKSCKEQDVELVALKADLELDALHSDPRFEDLLHCVGLRQ
jgi:TolB-like protein/Flp pilus assembly protein TadD